MSHIVTLQSAAHVCYNISIKNVGDVNEVIILYIVKDATVL